MKPARLTLRRLEASDWDRAVELVASAGLPTADLQFGKQDLMGAFHHGALIGTAGLEVYQEAALVRSVSVAEEERGQGIGSLLYQSIEDLVRSKGIGLAVLLTETAQDYFQHRGYVRVERETLPETIKSSAEFTSLCPSSAAAMVKRFPVQTRGPT